MTEVGGVAYAIAETVDHKAVRAKAVMSEVDWIALEAVDRREGAASNGRISGTRSGQRGRDHQPC